MKKHRSTIFLILIFCIGLSLLLYPTVSDYWNSFHQSLAIAGYAESVANLNDEAYETLWSDAVDYNKNLAKQGFHMELTKREEKKYNKMLAVDDTGIMGYIEIPKINCTLPIYHGTNEGVLQIAIGHIAGTSLPVGGKSTHSVLSGHRGLPSARLFTDIDQLQTGDEFMIRTLDETLTYEVDRILVVLPTDVSALQIEKGKDLCTLVTCTPYGVKTHRLLVRGHRIETNKKLRVTADATQIDPIVVAPIIAVPILVILLLHILVSTRKKRGNGE